MQKWKHVKRGTTYVVLGEVELQIAKGKTLAYDEEKLVLYQGEDGKFYARYPDEFYDGRFVSVGEMP